MRRPASLAVALVVLACASSPSAARAQPEEDGAGLADPDGEPSGPSPSSEAYQRELASIDTQADWATGFYVEGAISIVLGLGGGLVGFLLFGGSLGNILAIGGLSLATLGLVSLGVGIALDVGSGERRRQLVRPEGSEPEGSSVRLHLGPGSVGVSGTF